MAQPIVQLSDKYVQTTMIHDGSQEYRLTVDPTVKTWEFRIAIQSIPLA